MQISKSKPKKISILCTFKAMDAVWCFTVVKFLVPDRGIKMTMAKGCPTLLQELTEYYISHIGWRRTKQSGWWEISSTFAMDIFNFFQHFRWKFATDSKFSDYIPFTNEGNLRCFAVFRLYSLYTGWKSSMFWSFPIIFPLHRMEILDVSKFSDNISIAKDGNRRLFKDFQLYSLCKGWKYPTIRSFLFIFPIKEGNHWILRH
jgi:hypothetical protein